VTQPDFQPYPDEVLGKINPAMARLQAQFEFTPMNETNKRIFEMAAHNELGQAGFRIAVEWKEIYKSGYPTGMHLPHLEIIGRNRSEGETDHDRIKWGVVKGLADGQPGYVRQDGSKHEEPIKKLIF
jgi:hypothetical protein